MKGFAIVFAALGLLMSACGAGAKSPSETGGADSAAAPVGQLTLPVIPRTLTDPTQRAAYLVEHYWDNMDFANRRQALDSGFMEQSFVNFVDIFQYTDTATQARAVDRLLSKAEPYELQRAFLWDVAERYLNDPESPMRSEDIFILFLKRKMASRAFDEADRTRAAELYKIALKNRPGEKATDFEAITREGQPTSLRQMVRGASQYAVVVFYDPECDQCKETIEGLSRLQLPVGTKVILVDAEGDRGQFEKSKGDYPPSWTVAYATDPVLDEELYVLPAMPSIYLMRPDGTVVLKDALLPQVYAWLKQ